VVSSAANAATVAAVSTTSIAVAALATIEEGDLVAFASVNAAAMAACFPLLPQA
jgi:hypothetical protein